MDERLATFRLNVEAAVEAIRETERRLGTTLPDDYVQFLRESNGGEGPIGNESYLILWPVEELQEKNEGYKPDPDYAPDLVFIGTDGGNEVFAVRYSDGHYASAPLIGMSSESIEERGATFREFLGTFR